MTQDLPQSRPSSAQKKTSILYLPPHFPKILQLAQRCDAEAAGTLSTTFLRKCSPQKANPSPLSDSSSLLIVVCMEDKEKKVGLVWMISLRGLVWRVSVFFVLLLSCVVFCFCFFFRLFFLWSSSLRSLMDMHHELI